MRELGQKNKKSSPIAALLVAAAFCGVIDAIFIQSFFQDAASETATTHTIGSMTTIVNLTQTFIQRVLTPDYVVMQVILALISMAYFGGTIALFVHVSNNLPSRTRTGLRVLCGFLILISLLFIYWAAFYPEHYYNNAPLFPFW